MRKLDEIALNIELVLISIIEGVALSALAFNAVAVFQNPDNWQYIPFIFAGLAILLVFWSQAILHAVSFIRWPLSMSHMLMYFIAAFLQVLAYYTITNSTSWFFWWTIFSMLALLIYVVDLAILKDTVPVFEKTVEGKNYIHTVLKRHTFEMFYLVPVSILFNVTILGLIVWGGPLYHTPTFNILAGTLEFGVSFIALVDCVRNFKIRGLIIPSLFGEG